MVILENGFKGYIIEYKCNPSKIVDNFWKYCDLPECCVVTPKKKKRPDNRKYAYIYTKKGRVLATVDTKTLKAYKVEGLLKKTWKPIRKFAFCKWATLLNL